MNITTNKHLKNFLLSLKRQVGLVFVTTLALVSFTLLFTANAQLVPNPEPVPIPDPIPAFPLDHFKCYQRLGSAQPVNIPVGLRDQFSPQPQQHMVGVPEFFCNPVEKQHAGAVTPITNPQAHLTCYRILGPAPKRRVQLHNQLEDRMLRIRHPRLLCVPSNKLAWQQQ